MALGVADRNAAAFRRAQPRLEAGFEYPLALVGACVDVESAEKFDRGALAVDGKPLLAQHLGARIPDGLRSIHASDTDAVTICTFGCLFCGSQLAGARNGGEGDESDESPHNGPAAHCPTLQSSA